jgi:hypothetical protein
MRQLSTDLRRNHQANEPSDRPRRYRRPNLPPLFYSIISRNWGQALRRTVTHPKEIFSVEDISGDSPLHVAVKLDPPIQIINALMPICNEKNREGATALHVAASHRCSEGVIKIMLETKFAGKKGALTLSLSNRGRTPLHYACSSFRGLDLEAFRLLLEATIEVQMKEGANVGIPCTKYPDSCCNEDECDWEDNTERTNAFTMQDDLGYTPLSLLFKRYRERVKYVIRSLERKSVCASFQEAAANIVNEELGSLWLKARLIVCLLAESQKKALGTVDVSDAIAEEAARWAAQRHQSKVDDNEYEDGSDDFGGRKFRLVHASVALVGYGCPPEMIRLAMSVYPRQVMQMDEGGNLPLHIAVVAPTFFPNQTSIGSDEDSFVSSLSNLSGIPSDTSKPFQKVIQMLLRFYPEAAQIPHGISGRLPLILAMDAGHRSMDDGIKVLLEAHPAALESKEFDPKFYPYILSIVGKAKEVNAPTKAKFPRFGRKNNKKKHIPTALFECLKAKPGILLHAILSDEQS